MCDSKTKDWIGDDANAPRYIIGLTGRARSGKTSAADILERYGFLHVSFAHHIRLFVSQLAQAVDPKFRLERDKNQPMWWADGKTPRQMMQTLGTEWGRQQVHSELWVQHLMARITAPHYSNRHIVVSDVRFDNEALAIREAGGLIVQVHRECADSVISQHVSENGVDPELIDAHLYNNQPGLNYLTDAVWQVMKMLRENGLHTAKPTTTPESSNG